MPDPVIAQRRIQIEHVRIEAAKPFAGVKARSKSYCRRAISAVPEALHLMPLTARHRGHTVTTVSLSPGQSQQKDNSTMPPTGWTNGKGGDYDLAYWRRDLEGDGRRGIDSPLGNV